MSEENDKKFDAALAGFLHREMRDSAARLLCPDPETLAAYHERTLSLEELTVCKVHIAGCSRCQQVLAQLEATEEIPVASDELDDVMAMHAMPQTRLRVHNFEECVFPYAGEEMQPADESDAASADMRLPRKPHWHWIAPLGAIAASLLLLVVYHEARLAQHPPASSVQVAENRTEREKPEPANPLPYADNRQELLKKLQQSVASKNSKNEMERFDLSKTRAKNPNLSLPRNLSGVDQAHRTEADALEKALIPQEATGNSSALRQESREMADVVAAPAPPPTAAGISVTAKAVEISGTELLKKKVAGPAFAQNNSRLIVAPDTAAIWRVDAAGSIEFSSTGGKEWQHQTSGVAAELIAGSAPNQNVCWIVGRAGTILRTTDAGRTWRKMKSPISGDLGGVLATDQLRATVWGVPNHDRYVTNDGGATWNHVAAE
ncbi:MAG: hypothetical protein PVS2B2_04870 [Candidatus Acidiferrum sp.]